MKYFCKKTLMILLTLSLLFFGAACQKDTALPQNADETSVEATGIESSSGENSKEELNKSEKEKEHLGEETIAENNENTANVENKSPEKKEASPKKEAVAKNSNTETKNDNTSHKTSTTSKQDSSVKEEPKKQPPKEEKKAPPAPEPKNTVILSVQGPDGQIMAPSQVEISSGDTVFTLTTRTLKAKKIQYEATGSGATAYIEAINNLYEFDHGPLSGWIYSKNGFILGKGSGSEPVTNGDRIEWIYKVE